MEPIVLAAEDGEVRVAVDLGAYSTTALLKVAHSFTGRCHVQVEPDGEGRMVVRLRPKTAGADASVLTGDFLNAVLDQTLREEVARETEPVRNLILAHALSNTSLVGPELETDEPPGFEPAEDVR